MKRRDKNIIYTMLQGRAVWLFIVALFTFVSCNNDHCDKLMYSPLTADLYCGMDTLEKATPMMLVMKGMDRDSILDFTGKDQIELPLNSNKDRADFLVAVYERWTCELDKWATIKNNMYFYNDGKDSVSISKQFNNALFLSEEFTDLRFVVPYNKDSVALFLPNFDTLTVQYCNQYEFVSAECGCLSSQLLLNFKFRNNGIGIVSILNPMINNKTNEAQVKILLNNH